MRHDQTTEPCDPAKQLLGHRTWIGAEPTPEGARFRVWAPRAGRLRVLSAHRSPDSNANGGARRAAPNWQVELAAEGDGYFSGTTAGVPAEAHYLLQLDDDTLLPDPASRFQPAGPHGPSQLVDPAAFAWRDERWRGIELSDAVLYEMHIGTFTPEGTWRAAAARLPELVELGITVLEVMPIAEFPGKFGWSYDPAGMFAPSHLYGPPDDVRAFVDEAHHLGLAVILDVVYNHFGSVGERLMRPFSEDYFSKRHECEWGAAINFDGPHAGPVRDFFLANVRMWIADYHFDGLRVDATQAFYDDSGKPILLDITREARRAGAERRVLIVGESEPQRAALLRAAERGGCELDALWNDDFHHAAMVRLTGNSEAYYTDYRGSAEEFVAMAEWGFLYQGQRYSWQNNPRGTPALDVAPPAFVHFLQNHDQLANSARGLRAHVLSSPGRYRALTAVLLLAPQTPLLFQGQEFAESSPFLYFNDCDPEEADGVRAGRAKFLSQFPSLATREMQAALIDPCRQETFRSSQLDHDERTKHVESWALHRDLLRLRRDDAVIARRGEGRLRGATLSPDAFVWRFFADGDTANGDTRLLVVNLDRQLRLPSVPQPLVAPPLGQRWQILWSSEDARYGGGGTAPLETPDGWRVAGESAVLLHPVAQD